MGDFYRIRSPHVLGSHSGRPSCCASFPQQGSLPVTIPCLVLLSAVATHSPDDQPSAFYRASAALQAALDGRKSAPPIVRGQSPFVGDPLYAPGSTGNAVTLYPPTFEQGGITTDPGTSTLTAPYQVTPPPYYSDPTTADPWLNPGAGTV